MEYSTVAAAPSMVAWAFPVMESASRWTVPATDMSDDATASRNARMLPYWGYLEAISTNLSPLMDTSNSIPL